MIYLMVFLLILGKVVGIGVHGRPCVTRGDFRQFRDTSLCLLAPFEIAMNHRKMSLSCYAISMDDFRLMLSIWQVSVWISRVG